MYAEVKDAHNPQDFENGLSAARLRIANQVGGLIRDTLETVGPDLRRRAVVVAELGRIYALLVATKEGEDG